MLLSPFHPRYGDFAGAPLGVESDAAHADALRRADWRWLLPTARARRALCLAEGAVADSVAAAGAALAMHVDGTRRPGAIIERAYDLVVASDLERATLDTATAALEPDGTLVAVLARGARGARSLLRRRYASAFREVQTVVPWPSMDDARAWLPLDGVGARYFLRRRPLATRHPARRVWLRVRGTLDHAALPASAHAVVVARRDDDAAPWWARRAGATHGDWLILTPGAGVEPRVLGMTLGRDGQPDAVVKLSRTPDASRRMVIGAATLERLHAAGLCAARMAPSPLGAVRDGETLVATMESALDGEPLDAAVRQSTLPVRLEDMADWLVVLARATRGSERVDTWQRVFAPSVARFTAACGAKVDRALLDESVALLAAVGPMPTVLEHHDFRPWNVHVLRDGAMAAFDWDNARAEGLPGLDLLHGIATLAFALDGAYRDGRLAESRLRQESGAIGTARRRCRARYVEGVGITPDAFRAVQAFAWMDHAAEDAIVRPTRDRQPFEALWEVEARLALHSRR